ncbi:hypothetical protein GCM10022226_78390 [Sphaerisporangium flaviroseum]|uniref:Lipoprotein n=1 Tax=Sphaerisporangium flaviroseum TaxID=509199 RepID=A0ABP7JHD9_9ACTN
MKYVRPALAGLALALVAGCGGQVTPHSLVEQLQGAGYSCAHGEGADMLKEDGPNVYSCGGAWAFVYYSQEDVDEYAQSYSGFLRGPGVSGSYASWTQDGGGSDEWDFPEWNLLCVDDPCVEAATKLGWK